MKNDSRREAERMLSWLARADPHIEDLHPATLHFSVTTDDARRLSFSLDPGAVRAVIRACGDTDEAGGLILVHIEETILTNPGVTRFEQTLGGFQPAS
jgi:hypothetical protein